jgi:hypothetical protein
MTREQFMKISFRAYMPIVVRKPHREEVTMSLAAVDFDNELFTLVDIDRDWYADVVIPIQFCYLPMKSKTSALQKK